MPRHQGGEGILVPRRQKALDEQTVGRFVSFCSANRLVQTAQDGPQGLFCHAALAQANFPLCKE
jgi:hypothetical protein